MGSSAEEILRIRHGAEDDEFDATMEDCDEDDDVDPTDCFKDDDGPRSDQTAVNGRTLAAQIYNSSFIPVEVCYGNSKQVFTVVGGCVRKEVPVDQHKIYVFRNTKMGSFSESIQLVAGARYEVELEDAGGGDYLSLIEKKGCARLTLGRI